MKVTKKCMRIKEKEKKRRRRKTPQVSLLFSIPSILPTSSIFGFSCLGATVTLKA